MCKLYQAKITSFKHYPTINVVPKMISMLLRKVKLVIGVMTNTTQN